MDQSSRSFKDSIQGPFALFMMSAGMLFFANGLYTIPLATWLAPVFFIRFLRDQPLIRGIFIGIILNSVITLITWRGMIPVPLKYYLIIAPIIGVVSFSPYIFDRIFSGKLNGFKSSLVFPCAWVSFEYLNSLFNPYSTWGSLVYTQAEGSLAFLQLVALTGIWGPVFVLTWFGSVMNWIWESGFEWEPIKRGASVYFVLLAIIFLVGGFRLSNLSPNTNTTRVASIISPFQWVLETRLADQKELDDLRKSTLSIQSELIQLTKQAALSNADIVLWNEAAAPVFGRDEEKLLKTGSKVANTLGVYLLMSLYVRPENFPEEPLENKVILFTAEGKKDFEYIKSRPVPGEVIVEGDGRLFQSKAPFGNLSSVICYDMDFPGLVRQAGKQGTDIMLVPADDWEEITPWHTKMASFRAVENGFSMVRSTREGLSAAFDSRGRTLASLNSFESDQTILIADVPSKGTFTIYPIIGDLFAWICLVGLLILIVMGSLTRFKRDS